jgi:putative membrane-bound dehydrogenase-like protein
MITFYLTFALAAQTLFNGENLDGWHSQEPQLWKVVDGAIVGGDLKTATDKNSFLFYEETYDDFELRLQFRLEGDEGMGMVNSGVQFRSQPWDAGYAKGYQADIGNPGWWGSLFDEWRRSVVLDPSDMAELGPALNYGGWNNYVIRCEGPRIRLWVNDILTVDYREQDSSIPLHGKIALQLHAGGSVQVSFRDITLEKIVRPQSPLTPQQQRARFTVPEGYSVELVSSEEHGLPKPITVQFDDAGRMWSMTATEYPLDANESPEEAARLWATRGRDKVVYFNQPSAIGPHQAQTFADGLAMPMGLLPWKNGVILGLGSEVIFLEDEDGDGTADKRTTLLSGFGIQDSHLMPHQFTLMPSGWIALAQGAFNLSQVIAGDQPPVTFNYCKLGRFRPDGSIFETIGVGFNNIWGLVLDPQGNVFIQEANDSKYSVVPFQNSSSYPGIGNEKMQPYAPLAPPIAEFTMGGTGLSGLALSGQHADSFPAPWADAMFIANPITGKVQAVRVQHQADGEVQFTKLNDFVTCDDPWFRPVAIHFGPDDCLYIVDWYNKIISHNEVSREHPDRDKSRGRIWRVRHASQTNRDIPDLTKYSNLQLITALQSNSTWEMRAAWRQIIFRDAQDLIPELRRLVLDDQLSEPTRIHALWSLNALHKVDSAISLQLLRSPNRNLRREALRAQEGWLRTSLVEDSDPQVRAEAIRSVLRASQITSEHLAELIRFAKPSIAPDNPREEIPWAGRHGVPVTPGASYNREFERFLVRQGLEQHTQLLNKFLNSAQAKDLPSENRLLACLALPTAEAAQPFVEIWQHVNRLPNEEELVLLLHGAQDPSLRPWVESLFADPTRAQPLMMATLKLRDRLDATVVESLLMTALLELSKTPGNEQLVLEMVDAFQMEALQDVAAGIFTNVETPMMHRQRALHTLRAIHAGSHDAVVNFIDQQQGPRGLEIEALIALGESNHPRAQDVLFTKWNTLTLFEKQEITVALSKSASGSELLLSGLNAQYLAATIFSPAILERMQSWIPESVVLQKLWAERAASLPSGLYLNGDPSQSYGTPIDLRGEFTVEAWVKINDQISNADGLLGTTGGADINFHDAHARFYGGAQLSDLIIAQHSMVPDQWTHLALSRGQDGFFKMYINGELDQVSATQNHDDFLGLHIGRSSPGGSGTDGYIVEFRLWDHERSATEINSRYRHSLTASHAGLSFSFAQFPHEDLLLGGATFVPMANGPALMDAEQIQKQQQTLERFMALAQQPGNPTRGKLLFQPLCLSCHTLNGEGVGIAPALDGSANRTPEALLRAILTPDAATEPGYRMYRIETYEGKMHEGFMLQSNSSGTSLVFTGGRELFIPKSEIRREGFMKRSLMPTGLIDNLPDADISALLSFISSLQ